MFWWIPPGKGGMPLHDVVGVLTVKRAQLQKLNVQVSSIWAKGCMLDNCVCI